MADKRGTLIAFREWLEDCLGCSRPDSGVNMYVRTSSGRFRSLAPLQRRLGGGFLYRPPRRVFAGPSFSPDGRWIALGVERTHVVVRRIDLDRQIVLGSPSVLARLRRSDKLTGLAWSPTNEVVAIGGLLYGQQSVWVMRRDGTGAHRVLCACDGTMTADSVVMGVAWVPSGQIGVLTRDDDREDANDHAGVYVVSGDGSTVQRLPSSALPGHVFEAAWWPGPWWSPDGRLVVARHVDLDVDWGVALVSIDPATGRSVMLRTSAVGPTWSPDGRTMAFVAPAYDDLKITRHRRTWRLSTRGMSRNGWLARLSWLRRPPPAPARP